jgi:hypothetical protein
MKKWILLGIAVLVLLYVLKGFREGFQPEFLDNSQVAKTAQSKNSSYAQVTNNMVPPQGPVVPIQGSESPFRVNMVNSYIP